jgi:uncharacterized protein YdaU (DUF1376 family)
MARPESRWMPLDWGDYWRDTGHLRGAAHGAYLNLIGTYWNRGGPLPTNDAALEAMSKCTTKEWRTVRGDVLAFFTERDGMLHHSRVDRELDRAKTVYEKRREAARSTNAKRCGDRVKIEAVTERTPPPHITTTLSEGENHPSDDYSKPRPSRIPEDWKPSEKDTAYASDRKLDPETIGNVAEQFVNHWRAKPKQNTSLDWSRQWRTWVNNHIAYHGIGPYPNGSRRGPGSHSGGRPSAVAARNRILAKAGIRPEENGGSGDTLLRTEATGGTARDGNGETNSGPIIDADEWERVPEFADGIEGAHAPDTGHNGRSGGPINGLPETLHGLPGGCGAPRSDDASGH